MYCSKCGKELTGKERFCPRCGNEVSMMSEKDIQQIVAYNVSSTKSKNKNHEQKKRTGRTGKRPHRGRKFLLAAACCLILALIGITAYYFVVKQMSGEQYLAAVQNEEGKWGYINEEGEEVIPCEYDIVSPYWIDGVAIVGQKDGKYSSGMEEYEWGCINAKGEIVIPLKYRNTSFSSFNGMLAFAEEAGVNEDGEPILNWGFLDTNGNVIIDFKYQFEYYPYYQKNEQGWIVVSQSTDELDDEGNVIYNYGVIDSQGNEIIPIGDQYIEIFQEIGNSGMIAAGREEKGEMKYGYLNGDNEIALPFEYENAGNFTDNGLAYVEKNGKYGYINVKGEAVIDFQYEDAFDYGENGVAAVEISDGTYQYIDSQGNIISEGWDYAADFDKRETTIVQKEETGYGIIDKSGQGLLPPEYDSIRLLTHSDTYEENSNMYIVGFNQDEEDEYWALADSHGNMVDEKFDYIYYQSENGWIVAGEILGENSDGSPRYKYSYIDTQGKKMLELPEKYTYVYQLATVYQ